MLEHRTSTLLLVVFVSNLSACALADGESAPSPPPEGPDLGEPPVEDPGSTTPFDIAWCPGDRITEAQVLEKFEPGAATADLGAVIIAARAWDCQEQTGCRPPQEVTSVPIHRIVGSASSGYRFPLEVEIEVPQQAIATCTVPGPRCSVRFGALKTVLWPHDGRYTDWPWGVTPQIDGWWVQPGDWTHRPDRYRAWQRVTTTASCLFGSVTGRVYGDNGTYREYQLVIYGRY